MEKYIYTGPSWAASSYPESVDSTNLAKEWKIPYINTANAALSNIDCVKKIKALPKQELPIVWVYCEPVLDIIPATGMNFSEFVTKHNWQKIRNTCNQYCLQQINSLDIPILLIGAHSDIVDCNYSNITVAHHSWQKWLGAKAGINIEIDCWGAEIIHKFLYENPKIFPTSSLIDSVWEIYYFWEDLQKRNWFFEVHPSKLGNVEFAKFLKPIIENFCNANN